MNIIKKSLIVHLTLQLYFYLPVLDILHIQRLQLFQITEMNKNMTYKYRCMYQLIKHNDARENMKTRPMKLILMLLED